MAGQISQENKTTEWEGNFVILQTTIMCYIKIIKVLIPVEP